ncbi:estradiol 17-beta-dehydrogenase 8 [Rhipicephalus sanguineus]|uniref:estradiol 17-beta-dehydrogenase 8 n=1 Tax=Rhipicephalus sanguineus TaxID=34632 RepID=UPI001895B0B4|nr:estradiol 17-beta-dehydrogenase 8 [Rhipicephalus sanguineus]
MAAVDASFNGRLALVTGGAGGIGQAVCHLLATKGVTVVVADKQLEAAETFVRSLPGDAKHQAMYVDVGDPLSVEQLFTGIRNSFSEPLSIVAHCAGIVRAAPLTKSTDELFDEVIKIDLKGTFLVNRAAGRDMLRSGSHISEGGGAIVNISSLAAKCGSLQSCAYAAANAGIVALTKSAALELAKHGIRCNVVVPGWVETPSMANVDESSKSAVLSTTPLQRAAQPREIAEAIVFLCSPLASSYITGSVLEVTGGFRM